MEHQPIILERTFNASPEKVWSALTNNDEMKKWYFKLEDFKAEVGFQFQFSGGPSPERQFLHLCEVTEVIPDKKLTYSWRYDGYSGISYVSFELFPEGEQTRLKLTHAGLESFPQDNADLARHNFEAGWNSIINTSLKKYLEGQDYTQNVIVYASADQIVEALTKKIDAWWTPDFKGSAISKGDHFTVTFDDSFMKFEVEEITGNKKIVWKCIDANTEIPQNKREWIGTTIVWEIEKSRDGNKITLTHHGLTPELDCYEVCEKGWDLYFGESLILYLTTGESRAFVPK